MRHPRHAARNTAVLDRGLDDVRGGREVRFADLQGIIFPPASSMARARASTSKADSVPSLAMRSASRIPVMALMIDL
jgi:hypothetical protein